MNDHHDERELFPDIDAGAALRAGFQKRDKTGVPGSRARPVASGPSPEPHAYDLEGEIASGGMGIILKAVDRELGRDVALKVLRDELSGEPKLVQRFFEEARVTARLEHPGIVPVHEVGRDPDGRPYFAMRLVRGRELRRIIELAHADAEGWNQTRALSVIQKVCEAMAYAHDKGVIHRDLKPSNVMVGEFGEVYVMDWGLARAAGTADAHDLRLRESTRPGGSMRSGGSGASAPTADVDSPIVTMDGEVLGTPCYMAPEQALGRVGEIGPRSDVYSVGAMLYHLLTGEMPYVPSGSGVGGRKVLMHLLEGPPRPVQDLRPDVPSELVAVCEKAMSREPAQRYPSMIEMADDLRAFLEGRVVRAYESGAWAEGRKWVRRNRALAAALVLFVVALLVGLVVSLSLKARSDANFARAEISAQIASDERDRALKAASFMEDTLAAVQPLVALGRDTAMLREMMDAAWVRIQKGELSKAPVAEARLILIIGGTLSEIAQYEEAEQVLRAALEKARALQAGDDMLVADAETRLGLVLQRRGKLDEAQSLLHDALAMRKRLRPGDDKEVAESLENTGALHHARGELEAAAADFREALAMNRRLVHGDDDGLADNLGNLAVVVQASGDLAGAEPLLREAVDMQERLAHGDNPHLASQLNNLASLCSARGDIDEAERIHRRVLDMRRRLFKADHPDLAVSINNLASVLSARGDRAGAEPLFREALEMQQRLHPADHADVARAMTNLAAARSGLGDAAGAEKLYVDALAMQQRVFHGDHSSIATTLYNLAQSLRMRGDLDGAQAKLRESFEMEKRLFAGDHVDLAHIESGLASLLMTRGDLEGAEPLAREALEMRKRLFPGPHPDVARSAIVLARLRQMKNDLAGSEALYREALVIFRSLGPPFASAVATAQVDLGQVISLQKRFAEADEVLLAGAAGIDADPRADPAWKKACAQRIVSNYAAWDEAEPGRGIADRGAAWKQKLQSLEKP